MPHVNLILLLAVAAFIVGGCSDSVSTEKALALETISFQTTQPSYASGDTVTAVLQNSSARRVTYGNPFEVQERVNGKWTYIGPKLYFTLEAYIMNPGGQTTYRVALTDSLFPGHTFSGGRYRLTTSVGIEKNDYRAKTNPFRVRTDAQR